MARWRPRVIVIGAGFGGIAAAVRMLQDGNDDVLIVDRADGVGGVWRANTYPGAECDVPSHLYSLSFHPKPDWTDRFADQPEILDYLEEVARVHGLIPHLRLQTEVKSCEWDDSEQVWRVELKSLDGSTEVREADVVIAACGQLSAPAIPDIPGLADFAGLAFHSAQWPDGLDLTGKRVAVVGAGASAVQFLPAVVERASQVSVFQRSAPYIIGKANRSYSSLEQRLYAAVPATLAASRLRQYLWHELLGLPFTAVPWMMAVPEWAWRQRVRRDAPADMLEALQPGYRMGCKRLLRAPDWYATLSQPNVELVTDSISGVVPEGVRTEDGVIHPADVVIFGTGFAATKFLTPMAVTGRAGRELSAEWRSGARAYLGTAVPGFPNFFLLYGPGTNLGHSSIVLMIEGQLAWIRQAVAALRNRDLATIEVRPEVESAYDAEFRAASSRTVWEAGCSSWYLVDGRNTNNWPSSTFAFRRRTRRLDPRDITATRRVPSIENSQ